MIKPLGHWKGFQLQKLGLWKVGETLGKEECKVGTVMGLFSFPLKSPSYTAIISPKKKWKANGLKVLTQTISVNRNW
jgi:hypothetical protein